MAQVIALLGWERLQHYKDRDPPWVKLYRDILTTESWVLGTDISRLVQLACILLAARYQNATPLNFSLFRKVASLDLTERQFSDAISHLTQYKFVEIQGDAESASTALATCTSEAEKSRAEKSRAETDSAAKPRPSKRVPVDWDWKPEALRAIRSECPDIDLVFETKRLRDYEFGRARSDWDAVARNWMREEQKKSRKNGSRPTRYEELRQRAGAWDPDAPTTNPLLLENKR